jgi:RHS repeat-associated protein
VDAALGPDQSRLALSDGSAFAWLLPDLHGNVAAGIDTAETTVSDAWRYDGYGRTAASTTTSGLANPWTYQGRLDLSPTGEDPFYAAGARVYDPNLGTFTQLDSVTGSAQDPLSLNRYLYAEANPATLIDPDGHMAVRVSGGRVHLDQQRAYYTAKAQQTLRRSSGIQRMASALSDSSHAVASGGLDILKAAGDAWNATGGQAVGFGQGVAGGAWDAGAGLVQTAWEGGWWAYHSTAAAAFDNQAFKSQWDTNRAVGQYLWEHPGEAAGAVWSGITTPIATDWQSGNGGRAAGRAAFEIGSLALGFGALAKAAKLRYAARAGEDAASLVAAEAARVSEVSEAGLTFSEPNLQSQLAKHGPDWGFADTDGVTPLDFLSRLSDHIDAPSTTRIEGTYRGQPASHFLDPESRLNVFTTAEGGYWGAWRLGEEQLLNVLLRGRLQ